MSEGLTTDQIMEVKEVFTLFDKDNDGFINAQELGNVMRALGQNPTEAEIEMLTKEFTKDGNANVDLSEVLSIMSTRMKPLDPMNELQQAFKVFDKEGKGFIESSQLRHIMMSMGEIMTADEVEEMLRDADKDGEGKINYEDFVMTVTSK